MQFKPKFMMGSEDTEPEFLMGASGTPNTTFYLSLLAVLTALTTVATLVFIIPIPATTGYFNLGDSIVMIAGLLLGPYGGFFVGGVGSAIADLAVAPFFAPITFIVKGLEGFLVGLFSRRTKRASIVSVWDALGLLLGAIAMLLGYFILEILVLGVPVEGAFAEMIPFNLIQVASGIMVAVTAGPVARKYLRSILFTE